MSEWRKLPLKEITVKIGSGSTPTGGSGAYKETGVSLIRSQNVLDFSFTNNGLAFIDEEQAHALRNVIVEPQDVLLNITGDSVARCCSAPREWLPARVNQHVAIIRANPKHLDSLFLKYSLISIKDELLSLSEIGGTRNALTKSMLENLKLFVPSVIEQKAIASVLSSLDDKIDLLHRQNKTLESMAETLFRQWFIEETHADWEITTLDCHITVAKGLSYKGAGLTTSDNGIPLFSLNSVLEGGGYKSAGIKYYNGDFKERHIIKPGDIIVANTEQGHEYRLIGYPAIIPKTESELSIYTHHLFKISINDDSYLTNAFLYYLLCSKDMHEQVVAATNGSTVNQLSADGLQRPEFKLPPECMVKEFTTQIDFFWKKISINNSQIKNIESLRDTLLPKLMSGEVRVQYAEEAIASVA
ncbi:MULTISPECIES: restriction endonuclease subunit S [Enterobacteriaceae]|uniref:restriction endonuclease subunit S n=1 Tax=Enterobacteriaceae TaxID=543 RepID=UPI0010BC16F7|nr:MULTISPECIES: restriction endonuclease subunit S [Enterobacteriaceae]EFF8445315.1 restriction endonuclease subunit S [Escherichia coli]EFH7511434.1 restriction endonuclease subunit S [Escherichia coli]EFH8446720.1 restriction endonuclease subunit S [Escherichia coli]EFJ7439470.1 restriction endonuclease subunit S [Escherichia coli]EGV1936688.1 restriction endonuclease subunit S [Escherichia coli]